MLADEIAAALPELRAEAEALMQDTCRVTSPGEKVWDDDEGKYVPGPPVVVYEGPCRLRNAYPAPQGVSTGETSWAVDAFVLSLPIATSGGVRDGHRVEMLTSAHDPAVVGMELVVSAPHPQTHSTARRLPVRLVTRDA